ncbi:MAG TPA: hypothetical protein VD996_05910, partial [Chitinophagaceae bacterium]|nr:hypothetical protein [Chitinophagaceae bacterium]
IDQSKTKITLAPGNTHTEEELIFPTGDKVTLEVSGGGNGVRSFDVTENGVYVLNLKTDTVVGGMVNYSSGERTTTISGADLERMIDSTQQLIEGRNVSDEKKTYFIIPWSIKKVSTENSAKIIGPYKNIPYKVEAGENGKPVETYKFFTNKQKRETLDDLRKRFGS